MKKRIFLVLFLGIIAIFAFPTKNSADDEPIANLTKQTKRIMMVIVEEEQDCRIYNFKKELPEEGIGFSFDSKLLAKNCAQSKQPNRKAGALAEKLFVQGIERITFLSRYQLMILKGKAFSWKEIQQKLEQAIVKYYKMDGLMIVELKNLPKSMLVVPNENNDEKGNLHLPPTIENFSFENRKKTEI